MKINNILAKTAKQAGICDEWHDKILNSGADKKRLAELYISGLRFCLKNNYPTNDIIQTQFGDIAHDYGVYVDEIINATNPRRIIALGKTNGSITSNKATFAEIFAKHDADIVMHLTEYSFTRIDVFDNASVEIFISDNARLFINNYQTKGIIKIHESGTPQIKKVDKQTNTYKNG